MSYTNHLASLNAIDLVVFPTLNLPKDGKEPNPFPKITGMALKTIPQISPNWPKYAHKPIFMALTLLK